MKPPYCAVCGMDFRTDGNLDHGHGQEGAHRSGLVSFTMTDAEKSSRDRQVSERRWGGPLIGKEWFCSRHYDDARKLRDEGITAKQAVSALQARMGSLPTRSGFYIYPNGDLVTPFGGRRPDGTLWDGIRRWPVGSEGHRQASELLDEHGVEAVALDDYDHCVDPGRTDELLEAQRNALPDG